MVSYSKIVKQAISYLLLVATQKEEGGGVGVDMCWCLKQPNEMILRLITLVPVQCQWDDSAHGVVSRVWHPSVHELRCP